MTVTTDRADSGEIPRYDDLGEPTQNLARYLVDTPSFEAIPRRVIEIDDTVTFHIPETIAVVPDLNTVRTALDDAYVTVDGELEGPQKPPPPLPPVPEELRLRRAAPGRAAFKPRRAFARGRHTAPAPLWARLAVAAGGAMVLGAGIGVGLILAVVR